MRLVKLCLAVFTLLSALACENEIRITVTPEILVEPSSLVFSAPEEGGDIRIVTLMIQNTGDGPLLIDGAEVTEDDDTIELYLQDAEDWSGNVRTVMPESTLPITLGWRVRDDVRDIGRLTISHNAGPPKVVPLQTVDIDPELSVRTEPAGLVMQAGVDVTLADATAIAPQRVLIELGGQTVAPLMLEEVCLLASGSGNCVAGNAIYDRGETPIDPEDAEEAEDEAEGAEGEAPAGEGEDAEQEAPAAGPQPLFTLCEGNPLTVDACVSPSAFGPIFFGESKVYSVFFRPGLDVMDSRSARLQITSNSATTPSYVVRITGSGCVRSQEGDVCGGCGDGVVAGYEQCDDGNVNNEDLCRNNCRRPSCGDGVRSPPEECDDGNEINTDQCTNSCRNAACGDGFVQMPGEVCDDADSDQGDECPNTCQAARCGDGFRWIGHEDCDDGNPDNGDGCDTNCTVSACGNGVRGGDEECDDGNDIDGDGCDSNCKSTGCGNGIVTAGEDCEYLGEGTEYCEYGEEACARCLANCRIGPGFIRFCGDGVLEREHEVCDDGDRDDGNACTNHCQPAVCGDGSTLAGVEECDDGNTTTENCEYAPGAQDCEVCRADCTLGMGNFPTFCGDGILNGGEVCDRGDENAAEPVNTSCPYGEEVCRLCMTDCTEVDLEGRFCRDGVRTDDEECDPTDPTDDELCDENCTRPACGNGVTSGDEECDDGNLQDGDGCDSNCTHTGCGNGVVTEDEQCDRGDEDAEPCAYDEPFCAICTDTCEIGQGLVQRCGDGVVFEDREECDDGDDNEDSTDACTVECRHARCGDGFVHAGVEDCDDGDELNGTFVNTECEYGEQRCNVCTARCTVFEIDGRFCGDGVVTEEEECDIADPNDDEPCDDNCTRPRCGNDFEGEDEECDDGNLVNGDGCDDNCRTTGCGNGVTTGDEECDDGNAETDSCDYGEAFCAVCTAECKIGPGTILSCGDNRVDDPEECDDGDDDFTNGCTEDCRLARCGDGFVQAGVEECDDSNAFTEACAYGERDCQTCQRNCQRGPGETSYCGDDIVNGPEECDDGNQENGDGCDANCTRSECGNGIVTVGEQCDDANTVTEECEYGVESCAVCDSECRIANGQTLRCGDARVDGPEECDDGNDNEEDACSDSCQLRRCGDGHLRQGVEECDDGNAETEVCVYGQRVCQVCQADCTFGPGADVSFCGDGIVNGPEECDGGDNCADDCTMIAVRGDREFGAPCDCGVQCTTGICLGANRGEGRCSNRCENHLDCEGDSLCREILVGEENQGCADPVLGLGADRLAHICVPNETGQPCADAADCVFSSACIDQGNVNLNIASHLVCGAHCEVDAQCPADYRCDRLVIDEVPTNVCQPRAALRVCPDGTADQCVGVCPLDEDEAEVDVSLCSSGQAGMMGYCTCSCTQANECPDGFGCAVKKPAAGEDARPEGVCMPMAGYTCPRGGDGNSACPSDVCHQPAQGEGQPFCTIHCVAQAQCPQGYGCDIGEDERRGLCKPLP